jgi:hypothetical protein
MGTLPGSCVVCTGPPGEHDEHAGPMLACLELVLEMQRWGQLSCILNEICIW